MKQQKPHFFGLINFEKKTQSFLSFVDFLKKHNIFRVFLHNFFEFLKILFVVFAWATNRLDYHVRCLKII